MTSRKERRERAQTTWGRIKAGVCLNCGKQGPHYVPPSFGDPGFYMCESKEDA